jgi:hypothetical protein
VRRGESLYYWHEGDKIAIDLEPQVIKSEIDELEATAEEITALYSIYEPWFVQTLDPGETEALALYNSRILKDVMFCTGDAPAIKAFVMLGKSSLGISFETLLSKCGLTKSLKRQFTEPFFQSCCKQGSYNLITGTGLRNGI